MTDSDNDLDINTQVRDWVAELEKAVDDPQLIVDQRLLERFMSLNTRFANLHKEGPKRLKQAPSARSRRPAASGVGNASGSKSTSRAGGGSKSRATSPSTSRAKKTSGGASKKKSA